jgi:DNA repair protein RadD
MSTALAIIATPNKLEPRDYQTAAIDAAFSNWDARPSSAQIIVAPTGSGKTLLAGMAAQGHLDRVQGGRVLVLTHVPELVVQNFMTFREMFPAMHSGVYAAKLGRKDRRARVTFALIQSVARNIETFLDTSLIIIDECHLIPHGSDGQYRTVIGAIREKRGKDQVKILGLTATPYRLNSGNLLEPYKGEPPLFDELAYEIDMLDLLERGYLSKVVSKAPKAEAKMSTDGIHKRMGEFMENELNAKFNNDAKNRAIAKEIAEAGREQGRKSWLVFAISVDHAERLAAMLREEGVDAQMICGETPMGERTRMIRAFKQFQLQCLVSVNVLSTGFDHKGVDLIAMARPTASPGLYLQQAGRALRTFPGKVDALLLDFAGNVMRHGLLTSVKGVHKAATAETLPAPVKECPSCKALIATGTRECPECGHEFPAPKVSDREDKLFKLNQATKVMDDSGTWMQVVEANFRKTLGKGDKPPVLLLLYKVRDEQGAISQATESFCLDHNGWAKASAQRLWVSRTNQYAPATVDQAINRIGELQAPTQVRVLRSDCGRYLNVRGVRF